MTTRPSGARLKHLSWREGPQMSIRILLATFMVLFLSPLQSRTQVVEPTSGTPSSSGTNAPLAMENPNIYVSLAKKLIPSVVNISTVTNLRPSPGQSLPDDLFRRFFGEPFSRPLPPSLGGPQLPRRVISLGSGFIIDREGTILTNNHVIEGASEISVSFTEDPTENPIQAKVIGRDPELDIALLKASPAGKKIEPVILGNSDTVEIGEYVMAVGNPFGQGHSVTHGLISQKGRIAPDFPLTTYLQTDAPINPGNSGGPLVNLKGEVIAVNNAIQINAQGIGFAIPINVVKQVLPQLREKGRVSRGYLGVAVQDLTTDLKRKLSVPENVTAPFVTQVTENSPGYKAGIRPYDLITAFGDQKITSAADLVGAVSQTPVGKQTSLIVLRNGKEQTMKVTLAERPLPRNLSQAPTEEKSQDRAPAKIGATFENLTPDIAAQLDVPVSTKGVVISFVAPDSPAADAGLQPGDILLEADRKPIGNADSFQSLVQKTEGDLLLRIRRPNPEGADTFLAAVVDLSKKNQ